MGDLSTSISTKIQRPSEEVMALSLYCTLGNAITPMIHATRPCCLFLFVELGLRRSSQRPNLMRAPVACEIAPKKSNQITQVHVLHFGLSHQCMGTNDWLCFLSLDDTTFQSGKWGMISASHSCLMSNLSLFRNDIDDISQNLDIKPT